MDGEIRGGGGGGERARRERVKRRNSSSWRIAQAMKAPHKKRLNFFETQNYIFLH